MGLFSQKQQEPSTWAALPGEPLDEGKNERLEESPNVDLFGIGLGTTSMSMTLPVETAAPDTEGAGPLGEPDGADEPGE